MEKKARAAIIAAEIARLRRVHGKYSVAGRLKNESVEPVSRRIAESHPFGLSEETLIATLRNFVTRYPVHFCSIGDVQFCNSENKKAHMSGDTTRGVLSALTPKQLLEFASSGRLPMFIDETNDDE